MSHIATALAKSKGKDVKPPPSSTLEDVPLARVGPVANPFLQTVAVQKVEAKDYVAPPPPAERKFSFKRLLLIVAFLAVAAVGVAAWGLLGHDNPLSQLIAPAEDTPPPRTQAAKKAATKPLIASVATPSEKLQEAVRDLVITSAAGGVIQRLTIAGKVYQPGDPVAEGLVLQAIETEEIVFRDAEGNLYTRRK